MSNLLSSLMSSANALSTFDQVLKVTQNNVVNASTPGWAKQTLPLVAQNVDILHGSYGGVSIGQLQSSRSEYAEQAVREQNSGLGKDQQLVDGLNSLQALFDISGTTGIPYALNQFFQSASAWGQDPTRQRARPFFRTRPVSPRPSRPRLRVYNDWPRTPKHRSTAR